MNSLFLKIGFLRLKDLENFFENWRKRKPLIFNKHYSEIGYFTDEHKKIVKKYFDEGVIKEANC